MIRHKIHIGQLDTRATLSTLQEHIVDENGFGQNQQSEQDIWCMREQVTSHDQVSVDNGLERFADQERIVIRYDVIIDTTTTVTINKLVYKVTNIEEIGRKMYLRLYLERVK